jgi:hypothetical protein
MWIARIAKEPIMQASKPSKPVRLATALALLLSLPASAGVHATFEGLTLEGNYTPGNDVTITVIGNSEGLESALIQLILTVDPALILIESSAGTLADSDPDPDRFWANTGVMGTCGGGIYPPSHCWALDAFENDSFGLEPIDLLPSTMSMFRFDTSNASGPLTFSIDPSVYSSGLHSYFDLPGVSYTLLVPEPGSGLLLGLGLTVLGASRGDARFASRAARSRRAPAPPSA